MQNKSNMVLAAEDARGVLALLVRRPLHLDAASLDELKLIHRSLSTLVGTMDAELERRSTEPTDMAIDSEAALAAHDRMDAHCVLAYGGQRQSESARCRACWPEGTHPAERGAVDEPPEITGHHFGICVCLRCGPPWRTTRPWTDAPLPGFNSWMALCPRCGNKRCPGAVDHRRPCSTEGEVIEWPK